jgi:pyruvate dehydrogenase E2 component (dihydrolipoamide acetyltransferase)
LPAIEVKVPDIGDFKDVPVIEVLVKPGDSVKKDDSLITLESDKATMEVPAPSSGTVKEIRVKVGDKVSQGVPILTMEGGEAAKAALPPTPAATRAESPATKAPAKTPAPASKPAPAPAPAPAAAPVAAPAPAAAAPAEPGTKLAHASPGVRRFARELGVDINLPRGSGPKGRILKEDIQGFVKQALAGGAAPAWRVAADSATWPARVAESGFRGSAPSTCSRSRASRRPACACAPTG